MRAAPQPVSLADALPDGRPPLVVITGPTASGKSALSLALAELLPVTIINADASQVYADLSVLTARPDAQAMRAAPHRLYGTIDGADPCDASRWAMLAKGAIDDARSADRLPVLVGGTGLYIGVLLDGIAPIPPVDSAIRAGVRAMPVAAAHAALAHEDPDTAAALHPGDTTRVARALEVVRATGRSIRWWQARTTGGIADTVRLIPRVVMPPRDALVARADARVDAMIADGAIDEVQHLLRRDLDPHLPVMRAIGVRELTSVIDGTRLIDEAAAAIRLATRQYIKRQTTWMRGRGRSWQRIQDMFSCDDAYKNATMLREEVDATLAGA